MVGRVLRPKADGGEALLLDYGGNLLAHGLPDMPVAWSLAGRGRAKDEGEARCRSCPECAAVLALATRFCIECGHEFWRPPSAEIAGIDPGELVEIDEREIARLRGLPYAKAVAMADSFEDLKLIGLARGYKAGWAYKVAPELGIAIAGHGARR
jgi:hypothetical protein